MRYFFYYSVLGLFKVARSCYYFLWAIQYGSFRRFNSNIYCFFFFLVFVFLVHSFFSVCFLFLLVVYIVFFCFFFFFFLVGYLFLTVRYECVCIGVEFRFVSVLFSFELCVFGGTERCPLNVLSMRALSQRHSQCWFFFVRMYCDVK